MKNTYIVAVTAEMETDVRLTIERLTRCANAISAGRYDEAKHGEALDRLLAGAVHHCAALEASRESLHRWVDETIDARTDALGSAVAQIRR